MPVDPEEHLEECKARLKKVVDDCSGHFMHPIICDYMFILGQLDKETERADELETQRDVLLNGCVLAVYRFDRDELLGRQESNDLIEAIKYARSGEYAAQD